MDGVRGPGVIAGLQTLKLPLERVHRLDVEELAQLGVAEELAQLRLIDRQCLRAAFRERGIAVV